MSVATLLEGSVRKSGNRVRIAVQLVKVADSAHLWSETYDRTLDDIFAVQDDIAQAVVQELRATLLGEHVTAANAQRSLAEVTDAARDRSDNSEAQRLFLQARYLLGRKSQEELTRSVEYLLQAVALDPDFALGWAWLAQAHSDTGGWGTVPVDIANANALSAANKALALAPDLVRAHLSMAHIQMSYQWDWSAAERSVQRALQLAPDDADVLATALRLYFYLGRLAEAEAFGIRAVVLDPLNANTYRLLAIQFYSNGNLDEAIRYMQHSLALAPDFIASRHVMATLLSDQGRHAEALAQTEMERAEWARLTALSLVKWAMNTPDSMADSDVALAMLIEKHSTHSTAQIAHLHAVRGDADGAFLWLERGFALRDAGLAATKVAPFFARVRHDPRWPLFLKKMGFDR